MKKARAKVLNMMTIYPGKIIFYHVIDLTICSLGQHYCTPCARHFIDDNAYQTHLKQRSHKRRWAAALNILKLMFFSDYKILLSHSTLRKKQIELLEGLKKFSLRRTLSHHRQLHGGLVIESLLRRLMMSVFMHFLVNFAKS